MTMQYTKSEKEAWERFDAFMAEQGWSKFHLFMRGNKWVKGDDILLYDRNGWQLNGQILTEQELFNTLRYA